MNLRYLFIGYSLMAALAVSCSQQAFKRVQNAECQKDGVQCVFIPGSEKEPPRNRVEGNGSVPLEPDTKVDILFVVDNSKSMIVDQIDIGKRLSDFLDALDNVNWHIGVTTTDVTNDHDYSGGRLAPFHYHNGNGLTETNIHYIKKGTEISGEASTLDLFINTVTRPETRACKRDLDNLNSQHVITCGPRYLNGDERGIFAARKAIERNEHGFKRTDAPLHVVFISDEDERSAGGRSHFANGGANTFKLEASDKPENLISFANSKGINLFAHSLVIPKGDTACLNTQASQSYTNSGDAPAEEGTLYQKAAELTGGHVGNICDSSGYTHQLKTIGEIAEGSVFNRINIPCVPYDGKVFITINGEEIQFNNIKNTSIILDEPLDFGSQYSFRLECPLY